jgi:glycosyltransferase involved in cell wall biosynthesis
LDNKIKPFDAFLNLFSKESYHINRFICPHFKEELIKLLKRKTFDIIQLETLYLTPYIETIKAHSDAHIVMRAHNVEHEIWDRISSNTTTKLKKWYLTHLSKKLRNYEITHLNEYDFLVALTERDLKKFKRLGYNNGASASPIGIEIENYPFVGTRMGNHLSLCFIGSLDWMPNLEGLNWFLSKVWPGIHSRFPEITFHIAGRNTPAHLQNLQMQNVVVHGEVPNAKDFINMHTIMIVPLFSGSGMRVKILEGMALGKVVLTTVLGKEGIDAFHKENILIADTADEYIESIEYAVKNEKRLDQIGNAAADFVRTHFDNKDIAHKLHREYEALLVNGHHH